MAECGNPDCDKEAKWLVWNGKEPFCAYFLLVCTDHVGGALDHNTTNRIFPIDGDGRLNCEEEQH